MQITWLGHSSFRVEVGGTVVLIDPFLKGNPSFEASGLDWDEVIAGTKVIALTHGHDDHVGDTVAIAKATGATVAAVYELAFHLKEQGVETIEPTNTGGTVTVSDVRISFTDALHSSSSGGVYLGNPCGLIVRNATEREGRPVLYHMGDTDIFPGMALIADLYKPTVGLVPVGDRFTMGGKTAAYACQTFFNFKHAIPCHYGTFPIIDADPSAFVDAMASDTVSVATLGEPIDVA